MTTDLFERATRLKLRFPTLRGVVSVEDLWEMPLTSKTGFDLDSTAKAVNAQLKSAQEDSFVVTRANPQRTGLELQMEIIKHVIAVLLRESEEKLARAGRKAEKERLLSILESKQVEKMQGMSEEELKARIAELERA